MKINDVHIALDELLQTASNRHPSIEPHSTIDRGESDDDRHSSQKSSMLYHVSITKSMNVRLGCKSIGNPCSSLNCPKPWICSDEWLLAKCRLVSYVLTYFYYVFFFRFQPISISCSLFRFSPPTYRQTDKHTERHIQHDTLDFDYFNQKSNSVKFIIKFFTQPYQLLIIRFLERHRKKSYYSRFDLLKTIVLKKKCRSSFFKN